MALDPAELTDMALAVYGEELTRRGLASEERADDDSPEDAAPNYVDLSEADLSRIDEEARMSIDAAVEGPQSFGDDSIALVQAVGHLPAHDVGNLAAQL